MTQQVTLPVLGMTKYTHELLAPIVTENVSVAGVLRSLGLRPTGNNHVYITSRIKVLQLDVSHFKGQAINRGTASNKRITADRRLVLRDPLSKAPTGQQLRAALLEIGRPYICEGCSVGPVWNDQPLCLQTHHKNGFGYDDRPENLAFLCPNCHSQTENFSHKNVERKPAIPPKCRGCGTVVSKKGRSCPACKGASLANKVVPHPTKIEWPSYVDLKRLVEASSYSEVGRQLGVSDTSVRNRLSKAA